MKSQNHYSPYLKVPNSNEFIISIRDFASNPPLTLHSYNLKPHKLFFQFVIHIIF